MYEYSAKCVDCYDGDTCKLDIDVGFGIILRKRVCRLRGINTPELRGGSDEDKQRGYKARDFLRNLVLDKDVVIKTHKDETGMYGRLLVDIYTENGDHVNELLKTSGHAVEYGK
jgi:micrococcal nuclease